MDEMNIQATVHSNREDEMGILINSYNHMMQRIQELIRENYETQIAWLRKQRLLVISGEERDRMLQILEQAGFGHTQISDADAELVRGLLTRRT